MDRDAPHGNLSQSPSTSMWRWTRNTLCKGFLSLLLNSDHKKAPRWWAQTIHLHFIWVPLAGSVPSITVMPECILRSHQNTDKEGLFQELFWLTPPNVQVITWLSASTLPRAHRSHLIRPYLPNVLPDHSISHIFILPNTSLCHFSLELLLPGWPLGREGKSNQSLLIAFTSSFKFFMKMYHLLWFCKTQHPCTNWATGNSWLLIYLCNPPSPHLPKKATLLSSGFPKPLRDCILSTCCILP